MEPEYRRFSREDGTLCLKLNKALFGCIESTKLWQEEITGFLRKELGFTPNPKDPQVLNKMINGVQLTVRIFVDDLVFSCVNVEHIMYNQLGDSVSE